MTRLGAMKPISSDGATGSTPVRVVTSNPNTLTPTPKDTPVAWRVWCLGWAIPDVLMAPIREEAIAMFRRENADCAVIEAESDPRGGR